MALLIKSKALHITETVLHIEFEEVVILQWSQSWLILIFCLLNRTQKRGEYMSLLCILRVFGGLSPLVADKHG